MYIYVYMDVYICIDRSVHSLIEWQVGRPGREVVRQVYVYTCLCVHVKKCTHFLGGEGTNRLCTAPATGGLLAGLKSPSAPGVVPGKSIPSRGSPCSYKNRLPKSGMVAL